jgi:hypothetical protein
MFTNNGFNPRPEVRISYNKDWEEFRVYFPNGPKDNGYFTTDASDAYEQALYHVHKEGRKLVISASAKSRIAKIANNYAL